MTRISTYGASQSALMDLMRAQQSLFQAQQELSTGKKGADLKGVGYQAETIAASRGALSRSKAFEEAALRSGIRLDAQNVALERLSESVGELRSAMTSKDGTFVMQEITDAFYGAINALNSQHLGAYMFGGTRDDTKPMTISTLAELAALPAVGDAFQNNNLEPTVQVDQNNKITVGRLASDIATDIMASFKRIAEFEAGPNGPFVDPMTDAQQSFVVGELQNIVAAQTGIISVVGMNGVMQSQIESSQQSQKDRQDFLTSMISDIEDIDMAQAATNFQTAQNVLDVSAKTFATLTQVSLLNFLR
jgi:flagellar hook-associated protein 3 FlgL